MRKIILFFFILINCSNINAQSIEGIIKDINNKPLKFVNISIANNSNGVSSNDDGYYKIEIKANRSHVIAFSFVGFETEKIRIPSLK